MLQKFGKRILCCKQKRLFCSTILNGTSRTFIDQQYIKWRKDRTSVQKSWDGYFSEFESSPDYKASQTFGESKSEMDNYLKIDNMVQHFRYFGHKVAKLDPLKLQKDEEIKKLANFDLSKFGLNNVKIPSMLKTRSNSILFNNERIQNTDQLRRHLKLVYCDSVGYETAHIQNEREREWLYRKIESGIFVDFEKNDKIEIFETITRSCKFEKFLSKKWPVQKRFGLEGLESMIPGIKAVIETSSNLGVENFVLGMPHRGRLNVLVNVLEKSPEQIFTEFNGGKAWKRLHRMHSGDVKYHSGHSCDLLTNFGKKVHISLVANPSHLEACNTVVLGKTRAKQEFGGDGDLAKSMGFLIHGDAAFYGQGIVYETLMMSGFKGYETGGVMHIICNNQIGYQI
ncbi:hypothetical protein MHBO_001520 [Bonamia ostreae]|uniref:2-oxoglutarate dehydrogenase, mitochondrial n=1 Tax=Bonamia ostreae TaxID=126728 RepID=A0ABV2AJ79_9EUKA